MTLAVSGGAGGEAVAAERVRSAVHAHPDRATLYQRERGDAAAGRLDRRRARGRALPSLPLSRGRGGSARARPTAVTGAPHRLMIGIAWHSHRRHQPGGRGARRPRRRAPGGRRRPRRAPATGGIVLEGEAGIGKTALWHAGIAEAEQRGLRRARRTARRGGVDPLTRCARRSARSRSPMSSPSALPPPQRYALDVALLRAAADAGAVDARAVGAATVGVLRAACREAPVVLAVDDIQWLDQASCSRARASLCAVSNDDPVVLLATQTPRCRGRAARAGAGRGAARADRGRPARPRLASANPAGPAWRARAAPRGRAPGGGVGRQPLLRARAGPGGRCGRRAPRA